MCKWGDDGTRRKYIRHSSGRCQSEDGRGLFGSLSSRSTCQSENPPGLVFARWVCSLYPAKIATVIMGDW